MDAAVDNSLFPSTQIWLTLPMGAVTRAAVASAMRDAMDRHYAIALMTEGCGEAGEMARRLGELMGARVRPSVLGHSQRGSRPSARDRHLGLMCGRAAIDMLATGAGGAVLVSKGVPLVQTVARRPRDPRG